MNLRYIETFLAVVEVGSLTGAAQRLGITQSAVSLQLQKLEREFGARLLDRSRQPVVLTAAGEALLDQARQIVAGYRLAREAVQRATEQVAGHLVLAASTIPGEYLLPPLLARFAERYPGATFELEVTNTEGVYGRLMAMQAAFGFTGWRRDDLALAFQPFAYDDIVLLGPAGADPGPYTLESLAERRYLARESGSGTLATVAERLSGLRPSSSLPRPAMVLGSTQALLSAIRGGAGVGFASEVAARCYVRTGELVELAVQGLEFRRTLWMAYQPARATGALREAFLQFVTEQSPLRGLGPASD